VHLSNGVFNFILQARTPATAWHMCHSAIAGVLACNLALQKKPPYYSKTAFNFVKKIYSAIAGVLACNLNSTIVCVHANNG
jgi:hypothetical protein